MDQSSRARQVFVGIPTRSADLKIQTASSIVSAVYELGQAGMAMSLFFWSGDPLVSHARNTVLAQFLQKTDCDYLMWVDDDVSWEPGALVKLVNHPVDFVAGAYRHKRDPESYPVNWLPDENGKSEVDPATGLIAVRDVPFGFCRMTRDLAQRLYDAAADRPYTHVNAADLECRVVFDVGYRDGQYFGEDYVVCQKMRELGVKVWLDPEIPLNHTGSKTFEGHVGNFLRGNQQPVDPKASFRDMLKDVREALKDVSAA